MVRFVSVASSLVAVVGAKVLRPEDESGTSAVLAFGGRQDVGDEAYGGLLRSIQAAASARNVSVWVVTGSSFSDMTDDVATLRGSLTAPSVFYAGHGMRDGSGAEAQQAALDDPQGADGVVMLAAFLDRRHRPSAAACASKWSVQPTHHCPKGKGLPLCPGGYLPPGAHSCEAAEPVPDYALPTLTVGGGQDGVVRVARMAEAWYTQRATPQHEVALLEGMSHADLLSGEVPASVMARDLPSEMGAEQAQAQVAELVAAFLETPGVSTPASPSEFFQPFVDMFVQQEGSWWWTGNSDESGSSAWAAEAQRLMADPVPEGFENWTLENAFHLLSDEDGIPPYYRDKHRADIAVEDGVVHSSTVTQLRYTELGVYQTAIGLNGYEIIKEETCAVLSNVPDDGHDCTSAIEIATKLASRQLLFNRTGSDSPASLDDGDRCKAINEAALDLALKSASEAARSRFRATGRPLTMGADIKPTPPAGPWWIWSYLQYNDQGEDGVEVGSYFAFYGLDGLAYGAGNHYCKLLSPARALEWIYTDGLRPAQNLSCCAKKGLPCARRPQEVQIGKTTFCCPRGATADVPCPSSLVLV